MNTTDLIEAFWQARRQGIYFPPAYFGKLSVDDAYAIQLGLIERRCAAGERQLGWKVGLTARARTNSACGCVWIYPGWSA